MKKMYLDLNSKVSDPKVYATKKEMELEQELTKLKKENERFREFINIHLEPIFNNNCEGCRESLRLCSKLKTEEREVNE